MRTDQDVVVIGGGVIGVCAAQALAEAGRKVALLERGEIASGCSGGNAGLIAASHSIPLAAPGVVRKALRWMFDPESPFYLKPRLDFGLLAWLWRFHRACTTTRMRRGLAVLRDLNRASKRLLDELAAGEDLQFTYGREGLLEVFTTQKGCEEGIGQAELLGEFGIEAKVLDAAEVLGRLPEALPAVLGGVFFPGDGHVDPAELVTALARRAERRGATVRTSTEVLGLKSDGPRISAVETTRGEFRARHVVLAAGAWSPSLARPLGIRLPVQPAKGYSITVARPPACPALPLLLGEAKVAVTPLGERLRFSGTLEFAGLDLSINRRRVDAIHRAVRQYHRCGEEGEVVEIWRGLRPCTPDGLPLVGRTRRYDTWNWSVNVPRGPVTGKLVAQLICGEEPLLDPAPLDPARFG